MRLEQVQGILGTPLETLERVPGRVTQCYAERLNNCCEYFDLEVSFEHGKVVDVTAAHHVPYEHIVLYRLDQKRMFEIQPFEQLLGQRPKLR